MGASSRLLRTPWRAMSLRRPSQSQRVLGGSTFHMSCCRMPLDTGDPIGEGGRGRGHSGLTN